MVGLKPDFITESTSGLLARQLLGVAPIKYSRECVTKPANCKHNKKGVGGNPPQYFNFVFTPRKNICYFFGHTMCLISMQSVWGSYASSECLICTHLIGGYVRGKDNMAE